MRAEVVATLGVLCKGHASGQQVWTAAEERNLSDSQASIHHQCRTLSSAQVMGWSRYTTDVVKGYL